ncbi:hypothetical protein [Sphingomonas sp. OTU376]|uniref:hypothetical protein n=1 Tax=Sphingomonas sp. OTU376 TaxID=3043863 RepID=UPI00313F036A
MKLALATVAASVLAFAPAAQAQSLHETHQLVWAPSGKSTATHWRMRDKPACPQAQTHHQAGKSALPVRTRCAVQVAQKAR